MDSFGRCKEIAIAIAEEIPECRIVYGLYCPMTPKESWDKRWITKKMSNVFTHFWIEFEGRIIDASKEQFGEPEISIVPEDDARYVRIGIYHPENQKLFPIVDDPKVEWSSLDKTGTPTVSVVWAGYREHMRKLEGLRAS